MSERNAKELLKKYKEGLCSSEEKALLDAWYQTWNRDGIPNLSELDFETAEKTIWANINPVKSNVRVLFWTKIAAAIIVIAGSVGLYFYQYKKPVTLFNATVIKPGCNKAILTLSNGNKITLEDNNKGKIAEESGVSISKSSGGKISYDVTTNDAANPQANGDDLLTNAIETPKGGQFQVKLPDGTKVWLNAATKLTYPTKFTGNERNVTLNGEAYFEVVKNKLMPFKVHANNADIEVLGTHFNIMSYTDEHTTKTTLLEGSVKISKGDVQKIIIPGQQAIAVSDGKGIDISNVDTDEAIAWKIGDFNFNAVDIQTLMRQIGRWYDLDIVYEGKIPDHKFVGTIPRSSPLSEVIKVLELNHVRIKIKDKKVIIGG